MIAGPKLLLAIWGVMISAGGAVPRAVTLHSEVCLHGLMHLSLLFPLGNDSAHRPPKGNAKRPTGLPQPNGATGHPLSPPRKPLLSQRRGA